MCGVFIRLFLYIMSTIWIHPTMINDEWLPNIAMYVCHCCSLAMIMWEMLAGEQPWAGMSPVAVMSSVSVWKLNGAI